MGGYGARLARRKSRVRLPPGTHVRTIFRFNRPGYPHPLSSELENSGIRVAVSDCSVTERRRWRPSYQTGKTVHVHAKTLQTQRGRTYGAGCVRQWFRTGDVVTRIGIHTDGWAQHHPYLGVKLTSDLIWKTHIANISGKAKQNSQPSQAPLLRLQSRIRVKGNYHSSPPPPRVFIDGMGPLL